MVRADDEHYQALHRTALRGYSYKALPASVRAKARLLLLDTIGCIVSGRSAGPVIGFERGDAVSVVAADDRELARGLVAYASDEARQIAGRKSTGIAEVLGYSGGDEIIHRDDLVLVGPGR